MPTVSRRLPPQPHLDVPKREARELLSAWRKAEPAACDRIRRRHPKFKDANDDAIAAAAFKLSDAQCVVAREYGFAHWTELKVRVDASATAAELDRAIRADERPTVVRLVRAHPPLLHVPVVSGNWGPPMSHAANLGRLEIVQAMAQLGARDFQHAFDRALLQGQLETARWLYGQGAKLVPGIIMGPCETLNAAGFRFLVELGAPLTNHAGNRLAPLASVLGTYSRNPPGKHAILDLLAAQGIAWPDTPTMALHRGDVARLEDHLRRDPRLLERHFSLREIYPPDCGCSEKHPGMHWTPIAGTTLLHLAIDFGEREVFDWLLARGADVNSRAAVDADGFGGQTPLFHTVVNGPRRDPAIAPALLARGADRGARANLRKFLDWCETPRWHVARDVTPEEWAHGFPDPSWVDQDVLRLLARPD